MKRKILLIFLAVALALCAGCSDNQGSAKVTTSKTQVADVIESKAGNTPTTAAATEITVGESRPQHVIPVDNAAFKDSTIDFTQLDANMTYSVAYDMTINQPEAYSGATVVMEGSYMRSYDNLYHACFISDIAACCSTGIEFVWGDGSHSLTDYPEVGTPIKVTGTFELYEEEGQNYEHVINATMEVI